MKRKLFCLVALIVVVLVPVMASGNSEAESSKENYVIRLGHSDKPIDEAIIHVTALKFKELVEEYTGGVVKVEIYPANQLGDQTEQVKNVQQGMQEMFQGSVGNLAQSVPVMNYMALPYIFTGTDNARDIIDSMWDQNSEWIVEKAGVRPLIWSDAGFRNLTTADTPVKTLGDLKGLRIRVPSNPVFVEAFRAFGIDPVTLAWSETFSALQQGVVDGQENCYSAVQTESFYESQKFATDIEWLFTVSHFSISEKYFQSLPADIQDKIVKAGKDATKWERATIDNMNSDIIEFLKDKGVHFIGKPTDYDAWVSAGRSIWPKFYDVIGDGDASAGKAIVDKVIASN